CSDARIEERATLAAPWQRRWGTVAMGGGEIQNRRHRWSRDGKSSPWVEKGPCPESRIQLQAMFAPRRQRRTRTIAIGGGEIQNRRHRWSRDGKSSPWVGKWPGRGSRTPLRAMTARRPRSCRNGAMGGDENLNHRHGWTHERKSSPWV